MHRRSTSRSGAPRHRGGHGAGAPVEAQRLPRHVLLLAPAAGAGERDGELQRGSPRRGPPWRAVRAAGRGPSPRRSRSPSPPAARCCGCARSAAGRGDEAVPHEQRQRGLAVERVPPREPEQRRAALDPRVRGALADGVAHRRLLRRLEVAEVVVRAGGLVVVASRLMARRDETRHAEGTRSTANWGFTFFVCGNYGCIWKTQASLVMDGRKSSHCSLSPSHNVVQLMTLMLDWKYILMLYLRAGLGYARSLSASAPAPT